MRLRISPTFSKKSATINFPASCLQYCYNVPVTLLFLLTLSAFLLFGCASSGVQRDAAANVDLGVENAKNLVKGDVDIADAYQNTNQATKGAILGGAAGAITGALSTSIGVLPGTVVGAIFGASYGAYIDSTTDRRDRLENRDVSVIILGDQILIVLRSARIFDPYTSTIKPQAYSTLNKVAHYINRFNKILVKVTAYTSDTGSPSADLALSTQQADKVAKYLTDADVNARIMYAVGEGGTKLVDNASLGWDASDNYRIEISLERLYA